MVKGEFYTIVYKSLLMTTISDWQPAPSLHHLARRQGVTNTVWPPTYFPFLLCFIPRTLSPDSTMTLFDSCAVYISAQWQISLLHYALDPSSTRCIIHRPALRFTPYIRDILYALYSLSLFSCVLP